MNKIILLILAFMTLTSNLYAIVRVKGYKRKDGTYVAPHYRSDPDGYKYNNFSER